jgi:hypothetical protein
MKPRDPRTRDVCILLSAASCLALQGAPWLREPTEEEVAKLRSFLGACGRKWGDALEDDQGRPFFPRTVTREAPWDAWKRAARHRKLRWLVVPEEWDNGLGIAD